MPEDGKKKNQSKKGQKIENYYVYKIHNTK